MVLDSESCTRRTNVWTEQTWSSASSAGWSASSQVCLMGTAQRGCVRFKPKLKNGRFCSCDNDGWKKGCGTITRSPPRTEICSTLEPTHGQVGSEPWARPGLGQSGLGGFHQVVDVDVHVVVVFDVVHGGLSRDLVDDQARPFHAVIRHVLHLFTHKTLWLLTRLPVCWQQVFVLWK